MKKGLESAECPSAETEVSKPKLVFSQTKVQKRKDSSPLQKSQN